MEEWRYINFKVQKEKVLHLRQTKCGRHYMIGTGWLENSFSEGFEGPEQKTEVAFFSQGREKAHTISKSAVSSSMKLHYSVQR